MEKRNMSKEDIPVSRMVKRLKHYQEKYGVMRKEKKEKKHE